MTASLFNPSADYRAAIDGMLRMHQFAVAGEEDSDAADALREELDQSWGRLTAAERKQIQELSMDLYTLTEPPVEPDPALRSAAWNQLAEVDAASRRGDWQLVLEILRQAGPYAPPQFAAHYRAKAWNALGHPEVAVLFADQENALEATGSGSSVRPSASRDVHYRPSRMIMFRSSLVDDSHPNPICVMSGILSHDHLPANAPPR